MPSEQFHVYMNDELFGRYLPKKEEIRKEVHRLLKQAVTETTDRLAPDTNQAE